MRIPTIKIKNEKAKDGFTIINESDFDSKKHTAYKPKATTKKKSTAKKK